MKNYAIILASGSSTRFGEKIPKQFIEIDGETILKKSVKAFNDNENITDIILVTNPDYIELSTKIVQEFEKIRIIIPGGKTRQESSSIGVSLINEDDANVLIHDGARPFVSQKIINDCIFALNDYEAVGVAIPTVDTIIKIDNDGFIEEIPPRSLLRCIQTPQCFKANIIKKAHELAKNDKNLIVTDDCGLIANYNLTKVFILQGDENNIKITYKSDLN